jgi:hypothetical protein
MGIYRKYDVRVFDKFIDKFAQKYIEQRSSFSQIPIDDLMKAAESIGTGFDLSQIKSILDKNAVYKDPIRENGQIPSPLRDIYRSDMGELLTTYYFEEKLGEAERYIIPTKNISTRERYDMPGRGIDSIGYRIDKDGRVTLLLAEAKVSNEKRNPPSVVDKGDDSLYKSLKRYHDNFQIIEQRLSEYVKGLEGDDLRLVLSVIVNIENSNTGDFNITYGCGLVRDFTCVNEEKDYGKIKSGESQFLPGEVHFVIFSFTEATIESTIELFYNKVNELANGK